MRAIRRAALLTAALFLLLGLAPAPASAGGGGGGAVCPPATQKPPALTVWVRDYCFTSRTLNITAGQSVTWAPIGIVVPHTVTAFGLFDSKDLEGLYTVRFNRPGRYPYVCSYHSGMAGRIVVEGKAVEHVDEEVTVLDGLPEESTDERLAAAEERLAKAIAAVRLATPETVELAGGRVDESRLGSKPVSEILAWAMLALVVGLFLGRRGARPDPGDVG